MHSPAPLRRLLAVATLAAVAAITLTAPAPASAGPSDDRAATAPYSATGGATDSASVQTNCSIAFPWLPPGTLVCEFGMTLFHWPDGHDEVFIIGTNATRSIYHSWSDINGNNYHSWVAFPNTSARSGVFISGSWSNPTIGVIGADNKPWCSTWSGSAWSGFTGCYR